MVIIGAGRIGTSLEVRAHKAGLACELVSKESGWEILNGPQGDPVLVAVRNDDLLSVIRKTPGHRRSDLVFLQNGALRTFLQQHSLAKNSRGLLYFAATARHGQIDAGATSWFTGAHGLTVARWFGSMGLISQDVDWPRFSAWELSKLLWLGCFGLLCQAHDATVAEVCTAHRKDLHDLMDELRLVGRASMGVDLPTPWLVENAVSYSMTIPNYRASVKEWNWRNGWLLSTAKMYELPTEAHERWLEKAGVQIPA